jgi:hypothetical protein
VARRACAGAAALGLNAWDIRHFGGFHDSEPLFRGHGLGRAVGLDERDLDHLASDENAGGLPVGSHETLYACTPLPGRRMALDGD